MKWNILWYRENKFAANIMISEQTVLAPLISKSQLYGQQYDICKICQDIPQDASAL
jgi:hypothetical protein